MTDQPMAFPLSWPVTWPRTKVRAQSRFARQWSMERAAQALAHELELLGARGAILSTNVELRLDGLPRSNQRAPVDPGVAVYFTLHGQKRVLACDRWDKVEHNVRALALHVSALRGLDRWGVGSIEQAFAGYKALPETAGESGSESWWVVLGVGQEATEDQIRKAYRDLAMVLHPDRGGSPDGMAQLNAARDAALAVCAGVTA